MLLKGLSLPAPPRCATKPLPAHRQLVTPPPPANPLEMTKPEDTAVVRGQQPAVLVPAPPPAPSVDLAPSVVDVVGPDVTVTSVTKSRTTLWRKRKRKEAGGGEAGPSRKLYCCSVCGQVQSKGLLLLIR